MAGHSSTHPVIVEILQSIEGLMAVDLYVDDYGRAHVLVDDGGDMLEGELQLADGPMAYWIPRAVAETWRRVTE